MATAQIIGNWRITQDSPEYGCTDNPSYDWYATEYRNGHWTGNTLREPTREALMKHFEESK